MEVSERSVSGLTADIRQTKVVKNQEEKEHIATRMLVQSVILRTIGVY